MTSKVVKALVRMAPVGGLALLCVLPPLLVPATAFAKDGPYLTWGAKTAPVQQAGSVAQVPVPPSPYGQVGDPYLHVLNWGTKASSGQSSRPAPPAPVQREAQPPETYSPPAYRPAPQYSAAPVPAHPQPAASQSVAPAVRQPTLAAQTPHPTPTHSPVLAPVAAPVQAANAPASNDGAYQVPASSPYAARIAAARAAQVKADQKVGKPTTSSQDTQDRAGQDQAAVTETPADDDKPFVPGEHYTDASEAPRLYSLHRSYGLKPDPITVDNNASGAVLDTSHLDAAEAKAAKDTKADEDDDDTNTPSVPSKSTDAPSASGTQNASAGKTEKTSQ